MYDLEDIRKNISLVALAEEAGAKFSNPHNLSSRCPLPRHAGDRSSKAFTIYGDRQKWKCHSSCPSDTNGGDVFSFYIAWKGVDFKTAVAELAERCGLREAGQTTTGPAPVMQRSVSPVPRAPNGQWQRRAEEFITWTEDNLVSETGAEARAYLEKERGLYSETQRAFRLGYNPRNLYDDPAKWGLEGKKIWLPRGIVIPGFWDGQPWYIKVRRPLPGDDLGKYIGVWTTQDGLPKIKFGGPRGGRSTLFRLEIPLHLPVLVLVEGEWDTMLLWEYCLDLCDAGTIGGAGAKFDTLDLSLLTHYLAVLVVYDDDKAGEKGRNYIAQLQTSIPRLVQVHPPAHDLTDYWKASGNIRAWIAGHIAQALEDVLAGIDSRFPIVEDWRLIAARAKQEANSMGTKLTREQYQELEEQYNRTPEQPDAESVPGEHFKLIALLNRFGFYPSSKQEALKLARELLEQEYRDS